MFNCIIGLYL